MRYLKRFNESSKTTYTELSDLLGRDELSLKYIKDHEYIVMSDKIIDVLEKSIKYNSSIHRESPGGNNYSYLTIFPDDRDIAVLDEYIGLTNLNCIIHIVEMEDEWFRVDFKITFEKNYCKSRIMRIFICDQLDGLMDLLKNQRLLK